MEPDGLLPCSQEPAIGPKLKNVSKSKP